MTMSMTTAAEKLAELRRNTSDSLIRLAYHAALPVVIDPGLLNLLRVNFFLDPPDPLPFEAESTLLLSPLFREIGDNLYEIDPEIRSVLLAGLQTRFGPSRVREVALLLELYTDRTHSWRGQPELERAQQLTALNFVDPDTAAEWLEGTRATGSGQQVSREWFVAMRRRLNELRAPDARQEVILAKGCLSSIERDVRLAGIRRLAMLASLPEVGEPDIASVLAQFIRARSEGDVRHDSSDVSAALWVLRKFGGEYAGLAASLTRPISDPVARTVREADRQYVTASIAEEVVQRAPIFFLSYAHSPIQQGRFARFFADLSESVADLVSQAPGADPGFMDRSMGSGNHWIPELLQAVGTCQVFVALLSAPYFKSTWCSKEWFAFSQRRVTRQADAGTEHQTAVVPVIWAAPLLEADIPWAVRGIQRFSPTSLPDIDIAAQYEAAGVYGLLRTEPELYEAVVWRLAQQIARIYYNYHVEPKVFQSHELRDIFRDQAA